MDYGKSAILQSLLHIDYRYFLVLTKNALAHNIQIQSKYLALSIYTIRRILAQ